MRKFSRCLIAFMPLFLVLTLVFSVQVHAAASVNDWPVFRHDASHSGFSEGTAPTATAVQLWNYTLDVDASYAPGFVVVADGHVYTSSQSYDDNNLYCIDASSGALLWSFLAGGSADSSPAIVDGQVYLGSGDGKVYCLDASNGNQVWASSVGASMDAPVNYAVGKLYVESQAGTVYCLDAANGNPVWNYSTGAETSQCCPAVYDSYVFASNNNGGVFCLNAADGTQVWNFTFGGAVRSPAVAAGFVYFGCSDGNVYCLDVAQGNVVWNYTTWYNSAGPSHGYHWGNAVSIPAVAYGRVYVGSSDFDVFCLDALSGEELWNSTTGAEVYAAPSVANGCVFAGSYDGNLYCLNASSGAENWRYAAGVYSPVNAAGSVGSPAVANGLVYVVGNGVLTALGSPVAGTPFPLFTVVTVIVILIIAVVLVAYVYTRLKKKKTA